MPQPPHGTPTPHFRQHTPPPISIPEKEDISAGETPSVPQDTTGKPSYEDNEEKDSNPSTTD